MCYQNSGLSWKVSVARKVLRDIVGLSARVGIAAPISSGLWAPVPWCRVRVELTSWMDLTYGKVEGVT